MKADDKVEYEDEKEKIVKLKYTNFEELKETVEVLKDMVEEISLILRANHIERKDRIEAPYFDEDKVYEKLEELKNE